MAVVCSVTWDTSSSLTRSKGVPTPPATLPKVVAFLCFDFVLLIGESGFLLAVWTVPLLWESVAPGWSNNYVSSKAPESPS